MRKILNAAYLLFVLFLAYHIICSLCSCATVHKNNSSFQTEDKYVDTSRQEHQYQTETVTEEKSTAPVMTKADSAQTSGYMSSEDTAGYQQDVETDGVSLTTTVSPKVKDGKITGYQVNSKAVAKPKTVDVPIDRKVTAKTSGTDKQQTGIAETKKEAATTSSKSVFRFNFAGAAAIVGGIVVILLFLYFGGRFKKKKDEK
jgi:hypothetical protein